MANVPITAGSGTNIATNAITRDAVTEQMQLFNLADPTTGTSATVSAGGALSTAIASGQPDAIATGTITATDAVVSAPTGDGTFRTGTSTSGSYVFLADPGGTSAWDIQITGLTSGTLYFEASLDSTTGVDGNWIAVNGRQTGVTNTNLGYYTTVNGMYRGNTSGTKYIRIRAVGTLSGTPAIVIRMSTAPGALFLNASIPSGTNYTGSTSIQSNAQALSLNAQYQSQSTPYNTLKTSIEPSSLFYDGFDGSVIDVTNKWLTGGTTAPTSSGGLTSINPGSTTSGYSWLESQPTFGLNAHAYNTYNGVCKIETGVTTGNYRFFGFATPQSSPTVSSAVVDAVGFEIDTTGAMNAVVYAAGSNVFKAVVTRPTDGGLHRYSIYVKGSKTHWFIDGLDTYVAQASYITPNVQTLPLLAVNVNAASAPIADTFQFSVISSGDTGHNNSTISDGTYPWRKVLVTNVGSQAFTKIPTNATLTSTLLAASTTFTSSAIDVGLTGNSEIDLAAYISLSTAPSTTNGFYIQTSNDATNWTTIAARTATGGTVNLLTATVYQRYWRAVYTNGATAQTGTFTLVAESNLGLSPVMRPYTSYTGVAIPTISINDATASISLTNTAVQVKTGPGRLVSVLITVANSGAVGIYDTASNSASGTQIGYIPANAVVGTIVPFAAPAALGIYWGAGTSAPQATMFYA